jgi:transposase
VAYIKTLKGQDYLLPPRITDLFPADHVAYLVEQITDNLDYSEFDVMYSGPGGPAYHPRVNLKLLLMAHIDGIRSSRKIAKNACENVVYIHLAEKVSPDFRTISDFRKNNPKLVKRVFVSVGRFAHKHGLLDLSHLMIDGTTIKASANNDKHIKKHFIDIFEKYIDKVIKEGIKVDEEEDKLYGERGFHQMPEEFNDSEKRERVVKEIAREINEAVKESNTAKVEEIKEELLNLKQVMEKKGINKYSLVDSDSRFMRAKKGHIELSYNAQVITDKNGFILANDIVQDCDDRHQLLPGINLAEQNFGPLPEGTKVVTDGLYMSKDITKVDPKFDVYMPTYGMQKISQNKFDNLNFKYDEERDVYICPENKILTPGRKNNNKRYGYTRTYKCHDCPSCPFKNQCVQKNKMYKTILSLPHSIHVNRIKAKMQTPEGKETYRLRDKSVETAIGDLKHNKKFTEFLLRGLPNVKIEFNLACTARNLIRINNMLKGKTKKTNKKRRNISEVLAAAC